MEITYNNGLCFIEQMMKMLRNKKSDNPITLSAYHNENTLLLVNASTDDLINYELNHFNSTVIITVRRYTHHPTMDEYGVPFMRREEKMIRVGVFPCTDIRTCEYHLDKFIEGSQ